MRQGALTLVACASALIVLTGFASAGTPGAARTAAVPVPSLEPAKTEALWRKLTRQPQPQRVQVACRPLRGVFYAATDWLRLATKLAASRSSCADYYISIPPIVGDKTNLRPDQAAKIRALGPSFHALAEIHWTTWSRWVADNQTTWYEAGVEARRRMAKVGFDVGAGDTWAVNEFPSTVRTGVGPARANARELVRGLYDGEDQHKARGVVFIVGVGQGTSPVTTYQTNFQNWLADATFWSDMSTYVSDWSQETYGDYRRYAVPGAPITVRRDYLIDYLQAPLIVARAGPPTIEPARTYLPNAYSPVANAAWQYESGYGWTAVPVDQMIAFVSAQVYALRSFSVGAGLPQDHWGFAWQPRNASGLSSGEFAAQTGAILDRLASAIRDSGETDTPDPGSGACGPPGQNLYCVGDFAGAQFTEQWKSFRTWSQAVLAFGTQPQTVTAGVPSGPLTLTLVSAIGTPQLATTPITVTLASSSPQGQFSLSPAGPWSATGSTVIPVGSGTTQPFYYLDTRAGRPQLTATGLGVTTGVQAESVTPAAPVRLRIDPASATIEPQRSQGFTVAAADAFGNATPVRATWSVAPSRLGTVKPQTGTETTVTAATRGGLGRLIATSGQISASARLKVTPGAIRVSSIRYTPRKSTLRVTASVVETSGVPAADVRTAVVVKRNGRSVFSAAKRTDGKGLATFLVKLSPGCYRTTVTGATAPGYRWNGRTPPNRFCR